MSKPRVPAVLLEELRELAKRHGTVVLIEGCSELVRHFAVRGVKAHLAERRAEEDAAEQCPRCRERAALLEDTMSILRRVGPPPPEGRLTEFGNEEESHG